MRQGKLFGKEQEIIDKYLAGKGYDTLGVEYNVSGNSIAGLLRRKKIPIRPRKIISEDMRKLAIAAYVGGETMEEVGDRFDVSSASVLHWLRDAEIPSRTAEEVHRVYAINEDFFDKIDTEEKAYFLGFLYADGCNQMAHHYSVVLGLEAGDKEILFKFAKLIYKDEKEAITQVKEYDRTKEGKGKTATLCINSKHICFTVMQHGCVSNKTFLLKYPQCISKELHRHFIRGYFDGDGSLNNESKKITGCKITSTKEFLEEVKKIIPTRSNLYKNDPNSNKNTYDLNISGNRNIQRLVNWMYAGSTIHLKRKYEAYQRFCSKMEIVDENMRKGTQGYPKVYLNNYPDFYEPITVNNIVLNAHNLYKMSEEDKKSIVNDIFLFFRTTGFNFTFDKKMLGGYNKLCDYDCIAKNPLNSHGKLCNSLCKLYCKDYFKSTVNGSISIYDAFNDDKLLMKCILNRLCLNWNSKETFNISFHSIIAGFHSSMISYNISVFKPTMAKYIYEKYTNIGDTVYDYSAGWGARMLGAASCGRKYIGVDPLTTPSLDILKTDLILSDITLIASGSESVLLEQNSIDFAFSSPPYFDLERYSDDKTQSYNKGSDYFYNVYWFNTLKNIQIMLKPNKLFALNVSNLPKMVDMAKERFGNCVDEISFSMQRGHMNKGKDNLKHEPIIVFKNSK